MYTRLRRSIVFVTLMALGVSKRVFEVRTVDSKPIKIVLFAQSKMLLKDLYLRG
jgi:hypothetical protein